MLPWNDIQRCTENAKSRTMNSFFLNEWGWELWTLFGRKQGGKCIFKQCLAQGRCPMPILLNWVGENKVSGGVHGSCWLVHNLCARLAAGWASVWSLGMVLSRSCKSPGFQSMGRVASTCLSSSPLPTPTPPPCVWYYLVSSTRAALSETTSLVFFQII
jgi:hypothetical protein